MIALREFTLEKTKTNLKIILSYLKFTIDYLNI